MKYVEKIKVDVYPLLQGKKILERQIKFMLEGCLSKAGYILAKPINLGHVVTTVEFDEITPDAPGSYLFYWQDMTKDDVSYVALYQPFVLWVYVVHQQDARFADDFSYGKYEFPLGYEKTIGGGELKTAAYLNAYRLRCQVRLGLLWGGVKLLPTALVVDTIHITQENMKREMPLNKLFARLLRSNVAKENEYKFDGSKAEFIQKLTF